jgi:hypothetical protein
VVADANGRFEIRGLAERPYRLEAMDPTTVVAASRVEVPAGTRGVVLQLPTRDLLPRVAGRVVTRDRSPVAGARIRATIEAFRRPGGTWHESGGVTATDADGRFDLRDVPASRIYLRIDGEGIEGVEYGRGLPGLAHGPAPVEAIEIVVVREVAFAVELVVPSRADEFELLDPRGERLHVYHVVPGGRTGRPRWKLEDGRSPELHVRETAVTLVLFCGGVEVDRVPVALGGREVTVLRQ